MLLINKFSGLQDSLKKAFKSKPDGNYKVPDSVLSSQTAGLDTIKKALGVADNVYTFTASKKEGVTNVYGPKIAESQGKASLIWGEFEAPLENIKAPATIDSYDGMTVMTFEVGEDYVSVPLSLKKAQTNVVEIRAAHKNKTLVKLLKEANPFGKPLVELEPGEYSVVKIEYLEGKGYQGTDTYMLYTGEGLKVQANSKIVKLCVEIDVSEISEEAPATLTVYQPKTWQGKQVANVDLIFNHLAEDIDLTSLEELAIQSDD